MNRLSAYRLRLVCLYPLALLLLAAPLFAQPATPTPSTTPPATPATTETLQPAALVYQITDVRVEAPAGPGQQQIVVSFMTQGAPTGGEQLVLRLAQADALEVVGSTLDGLTVVGPPQADGMGYAWGDLPLDAGPHELVIDVNAGETIRVAGPTLLFLDAAAQTIGASWPLTAADINALGGAAQLVTPSPSPALTPTGQSAATALPAIGAPTIAATIAPTTAPTVAPLPIQPTATLAPASGGGLLGRSDLLVPLLIGGLFLLAALAIIGLLLTRRRRAPRPVTRGAPAAARPAIAPPPPVGPETVTGVLMPVYLQLEGDAPQSFAINETPFAIGRDPANNLIIDETFPAWQTVSREHALISRHERGYVVEDLGSQNGVRVNGRLTPKNLLRSGWQVSIGGVAFRFVDETQTNGWVAP